MAAQTLQSGATTVDQWIRWFALRPRLTLTLGVLAALVPFLTRPFNIDDPLFLWAARHIQTHPADPYGFNVNWYGVVDPMWQVTLNPPLTCYYLAVWAAVFGWSEPALHLAMLPAALAVVLGTYQLARRFCEGPMLAAAATLFTPVFLVSSTTVMCDVMMLAFWVWAVVLWVEGMERNDLWRLTGSGVLIALAALTKYFGACLIPLLAAYSLIHQRRFGRWAGCILIPIIALAAYLWATHALYGTGLLFDAGNYATATKKLYGISSVASSLTALAFMGACLAMVIFFAPWLWRARTWAGFAAGVVLYATAVFVEGTMLKRYDMLTGPYCVLAEVQIIFWAIGGVSVLGLAVTDVWRQRDARSCLLALWVLGPCVFVVFCWIVNGRSILPMAPAVGILLARRLEQEGSRTGQKNTAGRPAGLPCGWRGACFVGDPRGFSAGHHRPPKCGTNLRQIRARTNEAVVRRPLGLPILHGKARFNSGCGGAVPARRRRFSGHSP
jgi:4-amino-4-deoxy-L-arabinose transferase-like glycosyltransferase